MSSVRAASSSERVAERCPQVAERCPHSPVFVEQLFFLFFRSGGVMMLKSPVSFLLRPSMTVRMSFIARPRTKALPPGTCSRFAPALGSVFLKMSHTSS
eukprot:305685-Heterocapsa_arctica.AAC.1